MGTGTGKNRSKRPHIFQFNRENRNRIKQELFNWNRPEIFRFGKNRSYFPDPVEPENRVHIPDCERYLRSICIRRPRQIMEFQELRQLWFHSGYKTLHRMPWLNVHMCSLYSNSNIRNQYKGWTTFDRIVKIEFSRNISRL